MQDGNKIMYIRYIIDQLKGLLNYPMIILLYPYIYTNRTKIRYIHLAEPNNKLYKWLFGFLHNSLDENLNLTLIPNDYGDENFFNNHFKSNSKLHMFLLSWRWVMRNPMHNAYYSKKITGKKEYVKYYCTSHRKVSFAQWRTIRCKDINDNATWKYGDYFDYDNSILGKQKVEFILNGKRYFKRSGAFIWYIKPLKRLIAHEYKFGFEQINWAIQWHWYFKKVNDKLLREYQENYLKNKNLYITKF